MKRQDLQWTWSTVVRLQGDLDRGSTEHPREDVLSTDMKEKMEQPRNGVNVAHEDTEQKCSRKSTQCRWVEESIGWALMEGEGDYSSQKPMEKQWYPLALLDPKPPNVCGHLSGQPCLFPAQRTRDAGSHVLAIPPGFFPGHSKHSLQSSTPCKAQQLLWKTPLATQFCSLPSSDLSGKSVKECMSPCFEFLRTAMLTGKQHWTAMMTCCDLAATLSRFWSTGVSSLRWKGVITMILIMLSWSLSYKARFLLLSCCFFWCLHVLFHPDFLQTYQYLSFKSLLNMEKHWWNTDAMFYTEKKGKEVGGLEVSTMSLKALIFSHLLYAMRYWWKIHLIDWCDGTQGKIKYRYQQQYSPKLELSAERNWQDLILKSCTTENREGNWKKKHLLAIHLDLQRLTMLRISFLLQFQL